MVGQESLRRNKKYLVQTITDRLKTYRINFDSIPIKFK